MKTPLKPERVTIESNLKFFGLESGRSDGSSLSVQFSIPEGTDPKDLKHWLCEEKENLDLLVLVMERTRGAISQEQYQLQRETIKRSYDSLLKRKTDEPGQST